MPYDWVHMAKMAKPKKVHPFYIPDRASVYWLDYLIDAKPRTITDPEELKDYYENEVKKFPSAVRLSKPKIYEEDDTPWSCNSSKHRISNSALSYDSSNRINELSRLSDGQEEQEHVSTRRLPFGLGLSFNSSISNANKMRQNRADDPELVGYHRLRSQDRRGRKISGKADHRNPLPLMPQLKSSVKDAKVPRLKPRVPRGQHSVTPYHKILSSS